MFLFIHASLGLRLYLAKFAAENQSMLGSQPSNPQMTSLIQTVRNLQNSYNNGANQPSNTTEALAAIMGVPL